MERPGHTGPRRAGMRWRVVRLGVIAATVYVLTCALVFLFQTHLIYFPSHGYQATPKDVGLPFESLTLQTSDGVSISAWYVPHADAKASVIFCHGNAGNMADRLYDLKLLNELGYNVLMFDYRGFGDSGGNPTEVGTYEDAEAAWRHVTEAREESPGRIVLIGRSLGGAVAIELATRYEPGALVVESTFTRLADVGRIHYPLLPVSLLLKHRYESAGKVGAIHCPKLFLHGSHDALIPVSMARRLFEAAAEPKRFIETPGGHGDAGFTHSQAMADELDAFLDEAFAGAGR